jgi:hypothetical protein
MVSRGIEASETVLPRWERGPAPIDERSTVRLGDLSAGLGSLSQQTGASRDNELDGLHDDDAKRGAAAR